MLIMRKKQSKRIVVDTVYIDRAENSSFVLQVGEKFEAQAFTPIQLKIESLLVCLDV
jgi:hypothetical protein